MFTPPRAVLRNHPLGEVRSSCAAQWNWAFRAAPAFPTAGFRINALDGQPFLFVNKEVDPGMLAALRGDLVPWLEINAPLSDQLRQRMEEDPRQHRFTLVFDREAYSPEFFAEMKQRRIAILSYHKHPGQDWPATEFAACTVRLAGGDEVTMKLAARGT